MEHKNVGRKIWIKYQSDGEVIEDLDKIFEETLKGYKLVGSGMDLRSKIRDLEFEGKSK